MEKIKQLIDENMSIKIKVAKVWYLAKQGYSEIGFGISLITYALLLYSATFLHVLGLIGFFLITIVFVGIQPIVGYIFYKFKVMSEMHRINTTTSPYIDEIVGKKERWSYDATITQLKIQQMLLDNQIQINKKLGVDTKVFASLVENQTIVSPIHAPTSTTSLFCTSNHL